MGDTRARRASIRLERTLQGSLEDVWDLWTTKEGVESWWGPEGFVTRVRKIDVRPGGSFEYIMRATDPAIVEGMEAAGMPLESEARATYTQVEPRQRLAFKTAADFVPDVEAYDIATLVELRQLAGSVRMVVVQDAMHNAEWTQMATMGLTQQLDKLTRLLDARATRRT